MSPNAKRMSEINLEDFERRLRAAGSGQSAVEDPLEELTRLVNSISADRPVAERVVDFPATRPSRSAPPIVVNDPEPPEEPEFTPPRSLTLPEREPPPLSASRVEADDNSPPLLRPSFFEERGAAAGPSPDSSAAPEPFVAEAEPEIVVEPAPRPARARFWGLKIGGLLAGALVLATGAAYMKLTGGPLGLKSPPMILAATGPNKVAAPDDRSAPSPSDSGALLTKDSTSSGIVKVVSHQEQPIDLSLKGAGSGSDSSLAPIKDAPIIAPNQGAAIFARPAPAAASAAPSANPSPSPLAMFTPAAATAQPEPPPAAAAAKKGPKTVTVRPDGTLVTADASATASIPAAEASPSAAPPTAPKRAEAAPSVTTQAATPTLDLPTPAKPSKSQARVNVGKTDTTAPTEPVNAPLQLGSASEKPQRLPTKLRPPETTQVADAAPQPAAASGEWSVQLAAPRSEADAQSAIQRLQGKFGSALGDNQLGVRKADVKGETIYRVRASGLSKSDAVALCQKLKDDGGACFVAHN